MTHNQTITRCPWFEGDPDYIRYHDEEWGTPSHDDTHLFEMLILEGAQAGLSWLTILRKRPRYRQVFDQFNACKIAHYSAKKVEQLLADPGIVRNRLKVQSAIRNAQAFVKTQQEFGSFDKYIWQFVNYQPQQSRLTPRDKPPTHSKESDAMSLDLRKRGFNFVGTTICYAFMQAVGMVNDHLTTCFRSATLSPPNRPY